MSDIALFVQRLARIPVRALSEGFLHPGGELFVAFLVPQIAILVGIRVVQLHRGVASWPALFPKSALKRRSTVVDLALFLFAYGLPLVGTYVLQMRVVLSVVGDLLPAPALASGFFASHPGIARVSGTLVTILALDFGLFVSHWLHHKITFLWAFHAVHHSAPEMTPLTASRVHPAEYFVSGTIGTAVAGVLVGLWQATMQPTLSVQTALGTHVVYLFFLASFAATRHSSIPMSFGPLEVLFVSPRMHQVHHSKDPSHHDRNFGTVFSVWDALFGYRLRITPPKGMQFGVEGLDGDSVRQTVLSPFLNAARSLPLVGALAHVGRPIVHSQVVDPPQTRTTSVKTPISPSSAPSTNRQP